MRIFLFVLSVLSCSVLNGQRHHVILDASRTRLIDDLDMALVEPESIYQLNLSGKGYLEIPEILSRFPNLEYLDLSYNKIQYVDLHRLSLCQNLKILYLDNNAIQNFPIEIFDELPYLEVFNLGFNQIKAVDFDIKSDRLVSLNLHHNQLALLGGSWHFKSLYELRLDGNQLSNESIKLELTSKLKALNINDNQLSSIPNFILTLSKLKSIDLGNNEMTNLDGLNKLRNIELLIVDNNPFEQPESVLQSVINQRKLKILSFEKNQLKTFPAIPPKSKLNELSLINNQIKRIPEKIENATRLEKLWLSGNPLSEKQIDLMSRKFDKAVIVF